MQIIAIGGGKQSGKNSLATFLSGLILRGYNVIQAYSVGENDMINIGSKEDKEQGTLRPTLVEDIPGNIVKRYAFADSLKAFCVDVLCVERHKIYGTDEQKNEKTHIRWEDIPGIVTDKELMKSLESWEARRRKTRGESGLNMIYHEPGKMTGRELQQTIGTNIWRTIYPTWAIDNTLNRINKDSPKYSIITDLRFDNELQAMKEQGAYTIYLQGGDKSDKHESERGLSDFSKFNLVIDNTDRDLKKVFFSAAGELLQAKILPPL